jgi:putative transposase
MKVLKAYKTELDPNNKQRTYFRGCAGTARFVFNWALADRQLKYAQGEKTGLYDQTKRFNAIKDEQCPWIRSYPYAIVESAFRNCNAAFQHFFRRVKNGEKPGYPKFKARGVKDTFQLRNTKVMPDAICLTHMGWIRLKEQDYIPVDVARYGVYSTVSKRAGRWFVSILAETDVEQLQVNGLVAGVDLGIHSLAVVSNGKTFENPKPLYAASRKLKRLQRELARRKKGGRNWRKTKARLQRAHYRVANIRNHTLHQISNYLTFKLRPAVIVLEDLSVSGMMKNHHLARAIGDAGFHELRRQIEYKADWCGIQVVFADTFYPSSKKCSACGAKRDELTLTERTFLCDTCGFSIDRDLNAALNLAALVNRETHGDCLGS